MSRALMTLLGRPCDKHLEIAFDDLEKATGHQAIDARLVGDILHTAHLIIREMGLDSDVTAHELYHALRVHDDLLSDASNFVGLSIGGEVVSFHRHDLRDDQAASRRFDERSLAHMRTSLADEIARRYSEWAAHDDLLAPITDYTYIPKEGAKK